MGMSEEDKICLVKPDIDGSIIFKRRMEVYVLD